MTGPRRDPATERQVEAADPRSSTWVSANAGSGKTRVLTDRVARLLLDGAHPQQVLCLTYTKAAASEMQNRLFQRLGAWSMAEDDDLAKTLAHLGVHDAPGPATLANARRLFARAIETPGGLKIQTIHSFCASILRRFPIEAGLSPGFREMDDTATDRLQRHVLSELSESEPEIFSEMAGLISDPDFGPLCAALQRHRRSLPAQPDWPAAARRFGMSGDESADDFRRAAMSGLSDGELTEIADTIAGFSKTMDTLAAHLRIAARATAPEVRFDTLCAALLLADRSRPKGRLLTKGAQDALGPRAARVSELAESLATGTDRLRSLAAARASHVVHRFAARFLPAYETAKIERALLDFDDLIERTERLLSTPGLAEWVLYRLDGGIAHVLVDEAQDTSPVQWRVIDLLTREFTAGEGRTAPGERTLFVVGDIKQSIYSFQGADPASFLGMKDSFAERLERVGIGLTPLELEYSFRSAPEILRVVDETFPETNRAGLGDSVIHRAFKSHLPGRVELWPVIERSDNGEGGAWYDPVDLTSPDHHHTRLAEEVAKAARDMVDTGHLAAEDGMRRSITAGDILILVQSRGTIFHEVIRACKAAGLDVAGADVLKLGEELAVKDLTALLSFLDLPEDSLSLAAVLRSPLCGWSEADLYDLAAGRDEAHLWAALRARAEEFPQTHAMLSDLRDASEYLRPYELIDRILTTHDGRRRLTARLGPEAADGIDALLAAALAFERTEIPSLTGFLASQQARASQIKRQAEGRGEKLRVMTVHGAKGLESPIVILPDTAEQRKLGQYGDKLLSDGDAPPLWTMRKEQSPAVIDGLRDAAIARRREEARRLLYVAMTRAEQWLVVAAAGSLGRDPSQCWYGQVEAGLRLAGASDLGEGGLVLEAPGWAGKGAEDRPGARAPEPRRDWPEWVTAPAHTPPRPARPVAPSDLGGAKALAGDSGIPEEEAKARGTRLHVLLEHLAGEDPAAREQTARIILGQEPLRMDELEEIGALLDAPQLTHLFASDALAEVPVTASLPELGGVRVHGAIDRLVIDRDRVVAVDFKTNATVPGTAEDVPEGLLRQMGAYRAILCQIYPDHSVETAILWTRTACLMPLPGDLVEAALRRAHDAVNAAPGSGAPA